VNKSEFNKKKYSFLQKCKGNALYKYKLGERSFDYKRYDLSEFPEVLKEVIEIANLYS
jgi:hypothetical protein